MRLKSWVIWLLVCMVMADILLIVICLYMMRLVEIGVV